MISPTSVWKHCGNLRHSTVLSHLFIPSLIYRSLFVYPPLFCPLAFSLLTLRGEMRHAGNLLADNGGQLLSLLKPFMSWISSASSLARAPFPHSLLASTPIQTYSQSPCTKLRETHHGKALFPNCRFLFFYLYSTEFLLA